MSSKHTIGQIVSVDEQAIKCDEEEQFEGIAETPELRPSVEQTTRGKVDTNHPDGVGRGLTLAAEEQMVAREKEITRTRERWDRSQDSKREVQCRRVASEVSRERRCAFHKRAASVDLWCDQTFPALENVSITDLAKHVQSLTNRVDDLEQEVAEKDERIDELEGQVADLANKADEAQAHRNAIVRQTHTRDERIDELQAHEFEKGAHLLAENVDEDRITVDGNKLERITKDDGNTYFRLPGEEDALGRGGAVVHSTADLLPIQRLARYDDEMLASVTNRKPDELAEKAWRERDDAGRYSLWSKGSGEIRAYLDALENLRERGVLAREQDTEDGRRVVWRDDGVHRLSKHGEVELGPVDITDLDDAEVRQLARSSLYTWEFTNCTDEGDGSIGHPPGEVSTPPRTTVNGGDRPPDDTD